MAEPIVYTPQENPERIIMVFIDTLRADAMGMYGYERQTTPRLDSWAKDAAVFTQARSIALGHCLPQEQWSQAMFQKMEKGTNTPRPICTQWMVDCIFGR